MSEHSIHDQNQLPRVDPLAPKERPADDGGGRFKSAGLIGFAGFAAIIAIVLAVAWMNRADSRRDVVNQSSASAQDVVPAPYPETLCNGGYTTVDCPP
jgi:hypothetical protein